MIRRLAPLFTPLLVAVVGLIFGTIPTWFSDPAGTEDREFAEFLSQVDYFKAGRHRAQPAPGHVPEPGDCEVTGPNATLRLPIPAVFGS